MQKYILKFIVLPCELGRMSNLTQNNSEFVLKCRLRNLYSNFVSKFEFDLIITAIVPKSALVLLLIDKDVLLVILFDFLIFLRMSYVV